MQRSALFRVVFRSLLSVQVDVRKIYSSSMLTLSNSHVWLYLEKHFAIMNYIFATTNVTLRDILRYNFSSSQFQFYPRLELRFLSFDPYRGFPRL